MPAPMQHGTHGDRRFVLPAQADTPSLIPSLTSGTPPGAASYLAPERAHTATSSLEEVAAGQLAQRTLDQMLIPRAPSSSDSTVVVVTNTRPPFDQPSDRPSPTVPHEINLVWRCLCATDKSCVRLELFSNPSLPCRRGSSLASRGIYRLI